MPPQNPQQKTLTPRQSAFVSDRIHGLNRPSPKTLRDKLLAIAENNGHLRTPEGFETVNKYSYFKLLREWNEPTEDPSIKGRRMAEVQCVCGAIMMLPYRSVMQNYQTSCGCRKETTEEKIEQHHRHHPRLPKRMEDLRTSGPNHDGVHGFLKITGWFKLHEKIYWDVDCACGKRLKLTRAGFFQKQIDTCGSTQCKSLKAQGYTREQAERMFKAARSGKLALDFGHTFIAK